MNQVDLPGIYAVLQSESAVPVKFLSKISEISGVNYNSVNAALTGNPRVYVSAESKAKIIEAAIRILSDCSVSIGASVDRLKQIRFEYQPS